VLRANKKKWFAYIFDLYNYYYLLKRFFHQITVAGQIDDCRGGNIYIANHVSWWDGIIFLFIWTRYSQQDHYIMMDEKQLGKYQFFRKVGAFSINRDNLLEIRETMQYVLDLLQQGKNVWIFPQGEITHPNKRPYIFMNGVAHLLQKREETKVIPLTIQYHVSAQQKLAATVMFEEPVYMNWKEINKKELTPLLARTLERHYDAHQKQVLDSVLHKREDAFCALKGSQSTDETFDDFKQGMRKWRHLFKSSSDA
jgi:1-acyl-sn-glycerol-3-phosphate acyltransferase